MAKKINEIDATTAMNKGLEEFRNEIFDFAPKDVTDILNNELINEFIQLCYERGYEDGATNIGMQIKDILNGDRQEPSTN